MGLNWETGMGLWYQIVHTLLCVSDETVISLIILLFFKDLGIYVHQDVIVYINMHVAASIVATLLDQARERFVLLAICPSHCRSRFSSNKKSVSQCFVPEIGQVLTNVPQHCNSRKQFSGDHAMTCHLGGFLTVRHNGIITAIMP